MTGRPAVAPLAGAIVLLLVVGCVEVFLASHTYEAYVQQRRCAQLGDHLEHILGNQRRGAHGDVAQGTEVELGVDLGGVGRAVAKHLGDFCDRCAAPNHRRRQAVSEDVAADATGRQKIGMLQGLPSDLGHGRRLRQSHARRKVPHEHAAGLARTACVAQVERQRLSYIME